MIPQNAYVLYCLKEDGTGDIVYPKYYEEHEGIKELLQTENKPRPKSPYMFDHKDVQSYLKENDLVRKYVKILIAKVVDVVSLKIESYYKDQK